MLCYICRCYEPNETYHAAFDCIRIFVLIYGSAVLGFALETTPTASTRSRSSPNRGAIKVHSKQNNV